MSTRISRRDAIKAAGAFGAGALLSNSAASDAAAPPTPSTPPTPPAPPPAAPTGEEAEAQRFLADYVPTYLALNVASQNAAWLASTDVSDAHTEDSIKAQDAINEFVGEKSRLEKIMRFRQEAWRLTPLTARQIDSAFLNAADVPGTIPELVKERTTAEAKQSEAQDGYRFTLKLAGKPDRTVSANDIDDILTDSTSEPDRLAAWESSKEIGKPLKAGLVNLQRLRNACARELKFSSFFGLRVSEYDMSVPELMSLADTAMAQTRPLYEQLHCYTKHSLAKKYGKPVPKLIPAHWLPNRWGQEWPGLVPAADLDPMFKDRKPEWIIKQAEAFYVSMGFPKLPPAFWTKSDLWDLPADSKRKKNAHASAWHVDLDHDVRSLMSVKPNADWFTTTHHELGHIYYYLSYTDAGVPVLLRKGANRAFHEGIGELIALACMQRPYLKEIGVLSPAAAADAEKNSSQWLLAQALGGSNIVFQPFTWGVMTGWEHDFYEKDLPADKMNERWWQLAKRHQGIEPPEGGGGRSARGEEFCDPATKTHINDTAAAYYDYAICSLIVFQLHMYIAKNILKQDPRNCSYYGRKDVGEYLQALLSLGATRDWREVLRDFTGENLSARAMLEYFEPLMPVMQELNRGRDVNFA